MQKLCVISIHATDMNLVNRCYQEKLRHTLLREHDRSTINLIHELISIVLFQVERSTEVHYLPNRPKLYL